MRHDLIILPQNEMIPCETAKISHKSQSMQNAVLYQPDSNIASDIEDKHSLIKHPIAIRVM